MDCNVKYISISSDSLDEIWLFARTSRGVDSLDK